MRTLITATIFTLSYTALLSISANALANKPVTLEPSGDTSGIIDQQNIQVALSGASGNNNRINLGKGTFYVLGGVSAEQFIGKISGKGEKKTTIVAVGEGDPLKRNSVFLFNDSHFSMSKITIEVPADSSYLDSNPGLGTSDGGAAIDIIGGNANIKNVNIVTAGPFNSFGEESLETGILVSGCQGSVEIHSNNFYGIKRAVIFNPVFPSNCTFTVTNNTFSNNRGAVFALGGAPEAISDIVLVKNNDFINTLVGEMFFGFGVQYPISVVSNTLSNDTAPSNPSIWGSFINGDFSVTKNKVHSDHQAPVIVFENVIGKGVISANKIVGESLVVSGGIAIVESDNVIIEKNNFKKYTGILGFNVPDLTQNGTYEIIASTNITIRKEYHTRSNLENCQIIHFPFIDTSNKISGDLKQCEF